MESSEAAAKNGTRDVALNISPIESSASQQKSEAAEKKPEEDEAKKDDCGCPKGVHEKKQTSKLTFWTVIECLLLVCCVMGLIASFTLQKFESITFWGLDFWKWCVFVLVIFCGRIYTKWMMLAVIFLMKIKYLLNEKALYFVYGVRVSVRFFVWLCLVLLCWVEFNSSKEKHWVAKLHLELESLFRDYFGKALVSSLVGAALWMLKTLLVKIIASHFQGKRFFEKIKDAIFTQHVLEVLSSSSSSKTNIHTNTTGQNSQSGTTTTSRHTFAWAVEQTRKKSAASSWTMKKIIDVLRDPKLSHSTTFDHHVRHAHKINDKDGAKKFAQETFEKLTKKNTSECITEENLLVYFPKEDVQQVIQLITGVKLGAKEEEIKKEVFEKWLLKAYEERESLADTLKDSKTAIEELNRLASGVILIVILIVWLLMMGLLTTKIVLLVSSQLVLLAFIFGSTVRTVFEAIIFVFVVHPFNIGDRCVIDGVQMVVEEVNLLTTIFLKYDNEMIYYPNSVLATKPIGNFYTSPSEMGDVVEFAIDVSTKLDKINDLKDKIQAHLKKNAEMWSPDHSVIVKDFDGVSMIKMALYVTHTINFQDYVEKNKRRSDLILELKGILEDLEIKYNLLPLHPNNFKGLSAFHTSN